MDGILCGKPDCQNNFRSFLFPIPLLIGWTIGGVLLFLGITVWWRWAKLWHRKNREELVTHGLYRYVRHPHYLLIVVMSFGVTFLMQSLIFLFLSFLTGIVPYKEAEKEEKELIEIFGEQHKEYVEKVRWRFILGLI